MKESDPKIAMSSPICDVETARNINGSSVRAEPELAQLYRSHRWFELRDAISGSSEASFYSGAVAAVFNEVDECKTRFQSMIRSSPASRQAREAHQMLAWMYARGGEFSSALSELHALAVLQEETAELERGIELYATLARYPQQHVVERGLSVLSYKKLDGYIFIPLQVNGRAAHFMVDSGANISLITESQAAELRLPIQEVPSTATMMYGVTGTVTPFCTALVNELTLGRHTIKNVTFLVVADDQFDFYPGFGGALGLPVLLALRTLRWTTSEIFEAGFASAVKRLSECNLAFDNSDCVVQASSSGKEFDLLLDTGNNQTIFWPPFVARSKQIIDKAASGHLALTGVSGTAMVEHHLASHFKLKIGDFELGIKDVPVLRCITTPNSRWLSGHLGVDLLAHCESVTIDFPAMKLDMQ